MGACAFLLAVAGGYLSAIGQDGKTDTIEQVGVDCDPLISEGCAQVRHREGRRLFDVGTFGGNGRTCRTCHSKKNGTFSPEDARERLAEDRARAAEYYRKAADFVHGRAEYYDPEMEEYLRERAIEFSTSE
jgi:hypothetical protein